MPAAMLSFHMLPPLFLITPCRCLRLIAVIFFSPMFSSILRIDVFHAAAAFAAMLIFRYADYFHAIFFDYDAMLFIVGFSPPISFSFLR